MCLLTFLSGLAQELSIWAHIHTVSRCHTHTSTLDAESRTLATSRTSPLYSTRSLHRQTLYTRRSSGNEYTKHAKQTTLTVDNPHHLRSLRHSCRHPFDTVEPFSCAIHTSSTLLDADELLRWASLNVNSVSVRTRPVHGHLNDNLEQADRELGQRGRDGRHSLREGSSRI